VTLPARAAGTAVRVIAGHPQSWTPRFPWSSCKLMQRSVQYSPVCGRCRRQGEHHFAFLTAICLPGSFQPAG
jgi:hypothetical protein